MSLLEVVIIGYIINILFFAGWVLYSLVRLLYENNVDDIPFIADRIDAIKPNAKRGSILLPYATILEIFLIVKEEIKFREKNKSYIDFLESLGE